MVVSIRQATLEDVGEISLLFDAYRIFFGQHSDLALAEGFIEDRISHAESVIFCAFSPNGRCLGFAQLYPSFSSVSAKRIWILNDLFVIETARGMGIGTKLLNKIESFGKETKAKAILVETTTTNTGAQKLYETNSYQKVPERIFYQQATNQRSGS